MGSFDQLYHYCKVLKHQVLGPFNLSRSPKDADFQPVTSENHRNPVTVTKSMKGNKILQSILITTMVSTFQKYHKVFPGLLFRRNKIKLMIQ